MEKNSFHFIIPVLFCLTNTLVAIDTDQNALVAFKAQITSDPHKILAKNWSTTASFCNWIGVSCDLSGKRVTALNLTDMGLGGTIAPQLGNLSFLVSLDISHNNFNGFLPQELMHLRRLKSLDMSFNQLTGLLPAAIFNMSSLQQINLTNNTISGSLPVDICDNLPMIEALLASYNQLEGPIPPNMFKCKSLWAFSLSYNQLNGSIARDIGNLTRLKALNLGGNNFEGMLPDEIGNLGLLEELTIESSSLTGHIPASIFNISSLKLLNLNNNSFSGILPMNMPFNLPVLEEFHLNNNHLIGEIPSSLWECGSLRGIWLSENNFTGSISKNVGNLTLLRVFLFINNNLTGSLPEEIGNLNNLEYFGVSQNTLSGTIPHNIFNISTLKGLGLSFNQFTGNLPSSIMLPNLLELHLGTNYISGTIPESMSNCSQLTLLFLTDNRFTGHIPNSLGNMRLLERVYIGGNNLTREPQTLELRFFNSLTNCRQLMHLEVSLNQFNGILPQSIGNLSTSLLLFNAFDSKLRGKIPSEIGNLSGLAEISLDSNQLNGSIPTTLGRLANLDRLYLEHNKLQGYIPPDLCKLTSLGHLYLSDNMLSGPIPACLGNLGTLQAVFLDSNQLTSTIPLSLWNLKDLIGLNLSSNFLSGSLAPEIQNLKVITQVDLSWNQLSGDIPSTIGGAQSLVGLSLARNKLQGSIPRSLSDLISLESLDLSSNNLSGTIPKSLQGLRYLKFLNLSSNELEGEIPSGGCFENFTYQSFMQNRKLCGVSQLLVPSCNAQIHGRSRSKSLHVLRYILPIIALAILVTSALVWIIIRRQKQDKRSSKQPVSSLPHEWKRLTYSELSQATNGFSETKVLGKGGFGTVFWGTLSDGTAVAIKVFNLQEQGAAKSFDSECEVLRSIRHRNLVKIISSCTNLDFKALVLEYMPNGSLEQWLYSHNYCLDVLQRLNITIDTALALEYLHHGHANPFVHCDIKPSNVLLDEDMNAHLSDFGITKLLGEGEGFTQTKTLATIGYMAPEYGTEGIVSTGGDVYSYGILLMEMFTRKKPTDEMFAGEMSLKDWVSRSLNNGSIIEVVDANLLGKDDQHFRKKELCVSCVLGVAMDCLKHSSKERINMKDVVTRLHKIKTVFLIEIDGA